MFQSWRYNKEREALALKKIFDTASRVSLGRDAIDFIDKNHVRVRATATQKLGNTHLPLASYNTSTGVITVDPMENGPDERSNGTPEDIAASLVHETRHSWQDKMGILKTPYRPDLMLTNVLLTEGDAYSYDRTFTAQIKNPDISEDKVRELRYRHFRHMVSDLAKLNLYGEHLNELSPFITSVYKWLFAVQKMKGYKPPDFLGLGQTSFNNASDHYFPGSLDAIRVIIPDELKQSLESQMALNACDPGFIDQSSGKIILTMRPTL